jgi:hypothetical protein
MMPAVFFIAISARFHLAFLRQRRRFGRVFAEKAKFKMFSL